MIVSGFVEPITKELPLEYAVEMNRLIQLQMEGSVRLIVERTDFVSVPVTDLERSTRWYRDTLGLEQIGEGAWPEFQLGENVSLYLIDPTNIGQEFNGPHTASIALRVPDVEEARRELEGTRHRVRGRHVRHRGLPHGVLRRPGRQRADAASTVRPRD